MLILTGAPGGLEDGAVLERIRAGFRLVVPAAESALRWRMRLARENGAVSWDAVESLGEFITPWVPDFPEVTPAALSVIVMRTLETRAPETLERAAKRTGLAAHLARTIAELSRAGCDCPRLAQLIEEGLVGAPYAPALLRVYQGVEKELLKRGWALAATRVRLAAEEIRARGPGKLGRVLFAEFLDLPEPELHLIDALRHPAEVVVALPRWEGSREALEVLRGLGFREQPWTERAPLPPSARLVRAADPVEETGELARGILERAAAGARFGETAVVAPGGEPYGSLLRGALERAGIPARFHAAARLADHPLVRYMTGAVEAMLDGWEHEATFAILRNPASGFGATDACDRLDHLLSERLPRRGLRPLREVSDDPGLHALLDRLGALVVWTALRQSPVQWAAALRGLRGLVRTPVLLDGSPREAVAAWRAQAAALDAFDATMSETAMALGSAEPVPFPAFWRAACLALREAEWRPPAGPHNAVEVFDAAELPRWDARVLFVCGLADLPGAVREGAEPILPEDARVSLRAAGIPVRTVADERRRIETALAEALASAAEEAVLSVPDRDLRGAPLRPLEWVVKLGAPKSAARPWPARQACEGAPACRLRDERLIEAVRVQHESLRAAAIEVFLECPFRFFLEHTLCLRAGPDGNGRAAEPFEERVARRSVTESWAGTKPPEEVFERVFEDVRRQRQAAQGCRTEVKRLRLWRNLERYFAAPAGLANATTRCGESVRLDLGEGADVFGRVDRVDVDEQKRAALFELHCGGQRRGIELAGALHLLGVARAAGLVPAGLFRYELSGEARLEGWHIGLPGLENAGETCTERELMDRLEAALAAAREASRRIRRGVVDQTPAEPRLCASCSFADVCHLTPASGAGEAVAP